MLLAHDLQSLGAIGLAPSLVNCAACGRPAPALAASPPPKAIFSAGAGGRLCQNCAREARASSRRVGTLPLDVLHIADALARAEDDALATYRLPNARRTRVRDLVDRFLEYHLGVRPRIRRAPHSPRPTQVSPPALGR